MARGRTALGSKLLYAEQSESILGAAMKVLNTLKPGLNEKAYENALVIELKKRGHTIEQQRRFDVFYDGMNGVNISIQKIR